MRKLLYDDLKIESNWIVYALLFLLYVFLLPRFAHYSDTGCWLQWSQHIFVNGLTGTYSDNSTTNYLPLFHYFLYLFGLIQGSVENIIKNIHYLKIVPMIFEFIGGIILIKLLRTRYKNDKDVFFYSLLLFLNIGYFYNSIIWGQVDGMLATLVLLSFYSILKEKVLLSIIFILLALNFKLQAIVFVPMLGLLLLPSVVRKFSWQNLLAWVLIPVSIQILILLPFAIAGDLDRIWDLLAGYSGHYPVISMNAYNMWYWFMGNNLTEVSDEGTLAGLTFKSWGLIMFCLVSFAAMFPLLRDAYDKIIMKRNPEFSASKIFLIATIMALVFFFFNTEMHERYSHPAIIFVAIYSILTHRYAPYGLITLAYLLNMEAVLKYLGMHNYGTLIFAPQFVAAIYFIAILMLFFDLYKNKYTVKFNTAQQL